LDGKGRGKRQKTNTANPILRHKSLIKRHFLARRLWLLAVLDTSHNLSWHPGCVAITSSATQWAAMGLYHKQALLQYRHPATKP
jgi:hypothetical protein